MAKRDLSSIQIHQSSRITAISHPGWGPDLVIEDGDESVHISVSHSANPAAVARRLEAAARELAEAWEARGRRKLESCGLDPHTCEIAQGVSKGQTCERVLECRDEIGGTR